VLNPVRNSTDDASTDSEMALHPSSQPGLKNEPFMSQRWTNLAFLHWPYEPSVVQKLLPDGVALDTHQGSAWVGLIPFTMQKIKFPHGPAIPLLGTFPEVNVRTYVRGPSGERSVWFFSLDIPRLAPSLVARGAFGLPYYWGRGRARQVEEMHHWSVKRWTRRVAKSEIAVEFGEPIPRYQTSSLETFLTNRWSLISKKNDQLHLAQIHHPEWPLRRGRLVHLNDHLLEAAGLPAPTAEPHVLCSDGVPVWANKGEQI
jgi:uncharacterized protein YqjF (DUF2071 family)